MSNFRTRPPSDYESRGSHQYKNTPEDEAFDIQSAGRGGSMGSTFNYTSQKMVEKVNGITNIRFSHRKPLK